MTFVPDLAAIHNPSTGGVPTVAWGDGINTNFAAIGAPWTSYTPTLGVWTIGDGIITGAYKLLGKTLAGLRVYFKAGAGTTFTASSPTFSLPAGVTGFGNVNSRNILMARAFDASASASYSGTAVIENSATVISSVHLSGSTGVVTSTVPFTWAVNDELFLQAVAEVA